MVFTSWTHTQGVNFPGLLSILENRGLLHHGRDRESGPGAHIPVKSIAALPFPNSSSTINHPDAVYMESSCDLEQQHGFGDHHLGHLLK